MVKRYKIRELQHPADLATMNVVYENAECVLGSDYDDLAAELRLAVGARDYANDMLDRERARINQLEVQNATLTAEVMHYTAGTPHPRVAQLEAALEAAAGLRESDLDGADLYVHQWRTLLGSSKETAVKQFQSTPRPCGAASASLPGIAGTPNVCPRCGGKGGKSELKDGRTIYFCACDPCEYHDHRRLDQPCTCVKSTKDPNPLDPINADFRKCLKGHGHYDAWFPWCPQCPEFAEMTQAKTNAETKAEPVASIWSAFDIHTAARIGQVSAVDHTEAIAMLLRLGAKQGEFYVKPASKSKTSAETKDGLCPGCEGQPAYGNTPCAVCGSEAKTGDVK